MPPVSWPGFERTIPASAVPQTYALDRAAAGIGTLYKTRTLATENFYAFRIFLTITTGFSSRLSNEDCVGYELRLLYNFNEFQSAFRIALYITCSY
jgi:hypothetical protein